MDKPLSLWSVDALLFRDCPQQINDNVGCLFKLLRRTFMLSWKTSTKSLANNDRPLFVAWMEVVCIVAKCIREVDFDTEDHGSCSTVSYQQSTAISWFCHFNHEHYLSLSHFCRLNLTLATAFKDQKTVAWVIFGRHWVSELFCNLDVSPRLDIWILKSCLMYF